MKKESKKNNIYNRLFNVYRDFTNIRRIGPDSQMSEFWEDPTVEILVDSEELDALELEFGIQFDDDSAMELYDMTLSEAATFIETMIQEQYSNEHIPESVIDNLTPKKAKQVLQRIWRNNHKSRRLIVVAIEDIEYENKTK